MSLLDWLFSTDTNTGFETVDKQHTADNQKDYLDWLNDRIDTDDLVMQWKARGFEIRNRPATYSHFCNHAVAARCLGFYENSINGDIINISDDELNNLATYVLHNIIKFRAYGEDFTYAKIASIEERKKTRARMNAFHKVIIAFDGDSDA